MIIEIVMYHYGQLKICLNIFLKMKMYYLIQLQINSIFIILLNTILSLILFIGLVICHLITVLLIGLKFTRRLFNQLNFFLVWNQSRSDQLYALEHLTQLFKKYFPNKLIFPTLGNHEAAPCNL